MAEQSDPETIIVRIEFGSACCNHGAPEFGKLTRMLLNMFPAGRVSVAACQMLDYFNHFRVYVGSHLVFDSCTRYAPVIDVAKCIESVQQDTIPAEIPHSRGIPFCYWRCPEHEGKLLPQQEGSCAYRRGSTQRLSLVSLRSQRSTSATSEVSLMEQQQQVQMFFVKRPSHTESVSISQIEKL